MLNLLKVLLFVIILSNSVCEAAVGSKPSSLDCPIPPSWYRTDTLVIPVYNVADLEARRLYPTSRHITLELQNDIANVNFLMDENFTNTTLTSQCGVGYKMTARDTQSIAITIFQAQNITIVGLNISVQFNYDANSSYTGYTQSQCTDPLLFLLGTNPGGNCQGILIFDSDSIEIIGNSIYGTIDVRRSSNILVDGNFVTNWNNGAGIVVVNRFDSYQWTYGPITIRNNWVNCTGAGIGAGSMGANVYNNNLTNFGWSGVMTNGMLNNFFYNWVDTYPGFPHDSDGPGLYIYSWRWGINNTFRFNYVNRSGHCIYNDFWSGGTVADCNICAFPAFTYKLNMGWKVQITNILSYGGLTFAGWCESIQSGVCTYKTPPKPTGMWPIHAPWIYPMCFNTTLDGIPCQTDPTLLSAAGNCSGLSLYNNVKIASVKGSVYPGSLPRIPRSWNSSLACGPYPIADQLNYYNATSYSLGNVTYDGHYVSLKPNTQLAADFPCLASFPFDKLGMKDIIWGEVMGLSAKPNDPPCIGCRKVVVTNPKGPSSSSSFPPKFNSFWTLFLTLILLLAQ